jgi:hypothetical protein
MTAQATAEDERNRLLRGILFGTALTLPVIFVAVMVLS